jgi:hypothetical protein
MSALGLTHPEYVNGRRLWVDPLMSDLIHKLHHGDPVIGWEGDERLAVYFDGPSQRWELWRLEDDNEYRKVCHSPPGGTFDERVLVQLCEWDMRRRTRDLLDEINEHNDKVTAAKQAESDDYFREEANPRLRHAMEKDGLL